MIRNEQTTNQYNNTSPPFIYEISRGAIGKKFLGIFHLGREIWPPPRSLGRFSKHVGGGG